jgi:hypothetical protein
VAGAEPPCTGDLAAYRWTHRPLLVLAPEQGDPRHRAFSARAHELASELADRDVVLVHAFLSTSPRDPGCALEPQGARVLRAALGIAPADAVVVLVGKDGGEKGRQPLDAPLEPLLDRIDAMPMRQQEIRRRAGGAP